MRKFWQSRNLQVRLGDEGWQQVICTLATGKGPTVLSLRDCWLDQEQVVVSFFSSALPLVSSTCKTSPSKVSSLEELSYYHLSMEEGEVNDNTIKLTRAVNSDLTPTV